MKQSCLAAALVVALSGSATAQVAILQIQIVEGEGAVYAPGARSARPLAVEVTDETGRPVAGAAVSFHPLMHPPLMHPCQGNAISLSPLLT